MTTQPEALRLAECLVDWRKEYDPELELCDLAAAELRRLHAVNQELLEFAMAVVRYAGSSCDDYLADQARAAIDKAEKQV